ncbi:MAG: transporter substrate-binding domain-containing protein [Anaerolineae bacterium]|nr:transporter substrate-binding domain-containing protein [Anaerolineae bacterium]
MVASARRAFLISSGLIAFLLLASLVIRRQVPEPVVADLFPGGQLRIGIELSLSPYVQLQDGKTAGLAIELGQALAQELGLAPHFINVSQDGRFDALRLGIIDLLMVVDARQAAFQADILATRPWFNAGLVLVSHQDKSLQSMQGIGGRSLALASGSLADAEARRWQRRIDAFTILPYELPLYALDSLRLGIADAALVNALNARLYLRQHDLSVAVHEVSDQHVALALLAGSPLRWQVIDRALGKLFEKGTVARLLETWL